MIKEYDVKMIKEIKKLKEEMKEKIGEKEREMEMKEMTYREQLKDVNVIIEEKEKLLEKWKEETICVKT